MDKDKLVEAVALKLVAAHQRLIPGAMRDDVEPLSLGYCKPPIGCTKVRWWEVFRPFVAAARYHAANLAAHNWDVLLVGGRVFLFQQRYGGDTGHWLNEDGTREDATVEEHGRLYTETKERRFAQPLERKGLITMQPGEQI